MCTGNPVDSLDVAQFLSGYAQELSEHGYRPQSAAPWAPHDVAHVAQHLSRMVQEERGIQRVLAARDLFLLTVQWGCVSRGITATECHIGGRTHIGFA
jgi:hypothetical protein